MEKRQLFIASLVSLACSTSSFAATAIRLDHQPLPILQSLLTTSSSTVTAYKSVSTMTDFNKITHIRVQQTYKGAAVWGGDAVVHIPSTSSVSLNALDSKSSMNGIAYQGLEADLANTPAFALTAEQANKAFAHVVGLYQAKNGIQVIDKKNTTNQLIVYLDKESKAHWAYRINFLTAEKNGSPSVPTYVVDATDFSVYESWNDLQTLDAISGSGFGGNPKMGKLTYDGLKGDYPILSMQRDAKKKLCYLQNKDAMVKDDKRKDGPFSDAPVAQFKCATVDKDYQNNYWDGDQDSVNSGYSPANDALYIGQVIKEMYQKWYNLPVLSSNGKAMMLKLNVHATDIFGGVMENAFFLSMNSEMYFGDGLKMFYPLTSLGVGAHEISHGFTAQHANLTYEKQSGGLNESFSDMAAQAAEFYSLGKNSWQIGPEIVKEDKALRYMDDPTKDGHSIAHMKDYTDALNVHYTSGVFNKVFYLLGTSTDWDAHKAFDVMVKANMNYWTANSTFADAACGVMSATKDYKYDLKAVKKAFDAVGLDTAKC
jgi:pseudolysin